MYRIPVRSARVFEFTHQILPLNVVPPASNIQIGSFVDPAPLYPPGLSLRIFCVDKKS